MEGEAVVIGLGHDGAVSAGPRPAGEGEIFHVLEVAIERVEARSAEVVVVSGIGGSSFPAGEVGGDVWRDDGGGVIDDLSDLIFLPEEVAHFADGVVVGGPEGGVAGIIAAATGGSEERIVNDIMSAVVSRAPTGIGVPGESLPSRLFSMVL